MFISGKQIIIPGAGLGNANSSLAPRVGVPLHQLRSFSGSISVPGLHQGVNGAPPVIFTSKSKGTSKNFIQTHPYATTRTR